MSCSTTLGACFYANFVPGFIFETQLFYTKSQPSFLYALTVSLGVDTLIICGYVKDTLHNSTMSFPPASTCIIFRIQCHLLVSNTAQHLSIHTDYFPSMTILLKYVYFVSSPELS